MSNSEISNERDILQNKEQRNISVETFISEILAAEQRILIKQREPMMQKNAINLYKESVLIRELFSCITKYFNLTLNLSTEQYKVVKRVWHKAFKTALSSSQTIHNKSICSRIDASITHAMINIKVPLEYSKPELLAR